MNTNYFTAIFMAQAMLRIWVNASPPLEGRSEGKPRTRHIAFTCSVAAFVGVPGYIAYTRMSFSFLLACYKIKLNSTRK